MAARIHPVVTRATDAKRRLLALEREVARQIAASYHVAYARIAPAVDAFVAAYADELTRLRGGEDGDPHATVPLTWPHTSGRLPRLLTAIRGALGDFAAQVEQHVTHGQLTAARAAQADAWHLLHEALAPVAHLVRPEALLRRPNADAVYAAVGTATRTGAPLHTLLDGLPGDASAAVQKALYTGLALGRGPRAVGADLAATAGMAQSRALTISRTEMLGAYRAASAANYRANADVLDGWTWLAELGPETCGLCVAMNGTRHALDEDMDSHPNCRCTQVPLTKSWDALLGPLGVDTSDLPETRADDVPSGSEWFAGQSDATQDAILGKAGGAAYRAGDLSLDDLIGRDRGGGYYLKSLKEAGLDADDYLGG